MTPFTLTREQVRELDHRAIDGFGVPGIVLMENAGRGCAELLMRLNPDRRPTVVLCGPGNNGGDGFVIARHLDNHGWPVSVFAIEPKHSPIKPGVITLGWNFDGLPHDALANFDILRRSHIDVHPMSIAPESRIGQVVWKELRPDGWVVDALYGTGLSRPLDGTTAELVAVVNAAQCPVLAVDLPSGLDCDTGEPLGPTVRATHTATFVAPKRGFLNPATKAWTGEVHVIDIGAPRKLIDEYRGG